MNKLYSLLRTGLIAILSIILLGSCMKDKLTKTYTMYSPVYQTRQEILATVKNTSSQAVGAAGKIYLYGKYIFLNEVNKGVHIIDNSDPTSPKFVSFINIPGNVDIAVKGDVLYADMYADLLTIDIKDPANSKLINNVPRLFPERSYGVGFSTDTSRIIVGWTEKDTTINVASSSGPGGCFGCLYDLAGTNFASQSSAAKSAAPGMGGSMARFTIVNDFMYTVGNADLAVVSLSNEREPKIIGRETVGMNIETIYPFKDRLFIGSAAGMFIFNINNPSKPVRESSFQHARACDPVIADDKYAYVTLRTGNFCGGTVNTLDVIDVANVASPRLVKTYQLTNPHGLTKDGNLLFICDGRDGVKFYDASDVNNLNLLQHLTGLETYDAIAWNNNLLVVSTEGLHQFDYSDRKKLRALSTIKIKKS